MYLSRYIVSFRQCFVCVCVCVDFVFLQITIARVDFEGTVILRTFNVP